MRNGVQTRRLVALVALSVLTTSFAAVGRA